MYGAVSLAAAMLAVSAPDGPPEVLPWWAPIGVDLGLDTTVGIGTFVASEKADDPYWSSTISLAPSWKFDEHLAASLSLSLTYEWTYLVTPCRPASGPRPEGAPALDCSDASGTGRRTDFEDLSLEIGHDRLVELEGLKLDGGAAIRLPTSRDSQAAGNLFTLSGALGISRAFGPVTPSFTVRFAKFFPKSASPALDAEESYGDPPIGRCASFRQTDCIFLVGFVPTWRTGFDLGLSAEIPWVEGLSISMELGYRYTKKHGRDTDALSSTRTDATGRPVVDGTNEADTTSGTIELGYAFAEKWSARLGVSSVQPAKTEDGGGLRFPFYDFISPANNYTGWYLGLGYSL
jgi:hypothetical protein